MWSYYGSKANIVHAYPKPVFDKIIEPFAGSARYALRHFEKDVLLVDKYEVIVKIWKWLQTCSEGDILGLPHKFKPFDKIDDFKFDCEEAKLLMGFLINAGVSTPMRTVSEMAGGWRNWSWYNTLKSISQNLFKIRHWEIRHGTFCEIENERATWFIDPPYQFGGHKYKHSNKKIDFKSLSEWSKCRNGQVIVCENEKADWMDFVPIISRRGSANGVQKEVIWSNMPTAYHNLQTKLFQD